MFTVTVKGAISPLAKKSRPSPHVVLTPSPVSEFQTNSPPNVNIEVAETTVTPTGKSRLASYTHSASGETIVVTKFSTTFEVPGR